MERRSTTLSQAKMGDKRPQKSFLHQLAIEAPQASPNDGGQAKTIRTVFLNRKLACMILVVLPAIIFFVTTSWIVRPLTLVPSLSGSSRGYNDCLSRVGNVQNIKLYSQNDEDGALLQTLRCMGGHGTKEYFEFGSEAGAEVNTRILRDLYGWHGHLLDGSNEDPQISLHKEFFTPTNIASLLQKYQVSENLDVLSVDCDYDDFYVTREILLAGYRPRVLITEYNVNFGSQWSVSIVAKPVGNEQNIYWNKDCYYGVSAMAMIHLVQAFGYTPVFSNNVNLIFVRLDQAHELDMMIPSRDNFPGPKAEILHSSCSGRTWKRVEMETMQELATNANVDHVEFAASLPEINLTHKDYPAKEGRGWRMFQESD